MAMTVRRAINAFDRQHATLCRPSPRDLERQQCSVRSRSPSTRVRALIAIEADLRHGGLCRHERQQRVGQLPSVFPPRGLAPGMTGPSRRVGLDSTHSGRRAARNAGGDAGVRSLTTLCAAGLSGGRRRHA